MFLRSRAGLRRTAFIAALSVGLIMPMAGVAAAGPGNPGTHRSAAAAAGLRAYLVITAPNNTSGAKSAVSSNGGVVYASYDAIGVIVAHSTAADFASKMRSVSGVQQVGASRTSDVPAASSNPAIPTLPSETTPTAAETSRPDMTQIGADKAWDINTGSSSVLVGVIDTGVDDQHYDLKPNFDASKSVSCAYGKADTRAGAWRPVADHGTHVAGTIAAAKNGKGMVGVAPGVKIASIRVAEPTSQLFFPENVVCGFMYAGDNGFAVTNNSYWTDPWWANCPDNVDQAAIIEAVKRAADYATGKGVLNVVAAGNENTDLDNKSNDTLSPDDSTPTSRPVTSACKIVPGELDSSLTVASITSSNTKSSFSNFANKVNVAAPGDNVYSTLPGGGYGQMSGTSMATPHVVGVAALLKSVNPSATPADLKAKIAEQADDLACNDSRCKGTTAKNTFYGEGRVDALQAVQGTTPPPTGGPWENTDDVQIADNGAAATSTITIANQTGNAPAALKVDVNIVHPYRGDLELTLIAPDGSTYTLVRANPGDGTANFVTQYTVDGSAEAANGAWKLSAKDTATYDTGYINSWKITF
ncbi:S8 family serine peptidase [Actinokineospora sp. NBRC 105648]|uniref:S8 family peptidase n=1 Tax=Actinokineospora sp. NBRC 105648 TaxID=3032206 RepID=UPI0024A16902|nr:S8 family serine peptidase [Actinokineospora sp. NBRC 105648]GLZ37649.1 peptidase S8 [Actinokineospora sp. NBRC 105648]